VLTRRELIRLFGGAAALSMVGCGSSSGVFSDDERTALGAFADVISPTSPESVIT
jgi:hypothetical protein